MDILETLRSLKSIQPDSDYTLRSRQAILNTPPVALPWYRQLPLVWEDAVRSPALSLALLVLAFAGSIGFARMFAPTSAVGSLDTRALEAEAEAVDIQLTLTNLQYQELAELEAATRKSPATRPSLTKKPAPKTEAQEPVGLTGENAPATTSTNLAIDQALEELSQ